MSLYSRAAGRRGNLNRKTALVITIALVLLAGTLFLLVVNRYQKDISEVCDLTFTGNVQLKGVLVARTKAQQAKGLSGYLTAEPGMLFIFERPGPLFFWMRHTKMPLSIGFISAEGVLFQIEDMPPNSEVYHLSIKPAQYALELSQGGFDRAGLKVGSKLMVCTLNPRVKNLVMTK